MKDGLRFVYCDMHIMEPVDLHDKYLDKSVVFCRFWQRNWTRLRIIAIKWGKHKFHSGRTYKSVSAVTYLTCGT